MLIAPAMRLPAFAQAMTEGDDTIATDMGDLVIHPIHHAALTLTWNGMTILVDPAPKPGGGEGDVTAEYTALPAPDLILVTHQHGDHFNTDILSAVDGDAPIVVPQDVADKMPDDLKAHATVLANGSSATVAGVPIEAVPAYNITPDRLKYHPKERHDNGYILTLGGKRIYIAGDTEDIPEMRALKNIDAAFLPMNLPYTMDIEQAASAVKAFKPGIVYPYHYGQSDVEAFKTMVADASDVRLLKWY
jgi:L-ascorbate metabolism protein UlaG (beta-lactamase superfamily)